MKYRRDVTSVINTGDEKVKIEGYNNLDKTVVCPSNEVAEIVADKLDRLSKENFNRVHILQFDYYINENAIRYRVEFIKGYHLGTVSKFKKAIYEDVVERESDWTFDDYGMGNFVVEWKTDKIYAVDFTSYCYYPDKDERRKSWDKYQQREKEVLEWLKL